MPDLSGKVAIVTGAASGIGEATARRLSSDGATVILTDINEGAGSQLAGDIGGEFLAQDVADAARWSELADEVGSSFGRLDILVNNAGYTIGKSIEDISLDGWNRGLQVLLTGVMLGCQNAIRVMKANPGGPSGSIINISSTTAYASLPNDVTYTAAKSGVRMLTKSVAVHCGQKGYDIRCNSVLPGATDTGLFKAVDSIYPELRHRIAATSPLNRLADPAETAAAIAFLASDECRYMTGAEMLVDGAALAVHPGY